MTAATERARADLAADLPADCRLAIVAIDGSHRVFEQDQPPARASDRRLREFAAGRSAARRALAALGVAAPALPPAADRSPCWPPGVVGSIAHGGELALAVVARQPQLALLGIDVEPVHALDHDLVDLILTGGERGRGLAADPLAAFCAKEAAFKAAWPRLRRFLEFADIELEASAESLPDGRSRYRVVGGPVGPLRLEIAVTRSDAYQYALAWSTGS